MIDFEWIKAQRRPIAIHCPSQDDIISVLNAVNQYRIKPWTLDRIHGYSDAVYSEYRTESCVRIRFKMDGSVAIGEERRSFYKDHTDYILAEIDDVRMENTDLGEFDNCEVDISLLFGEEGLDGCLSR